jgi:SSS family solute:Na+ symporter
MFAVPKLQFLNRMAVCFALCVVVFFVIRFFRPLKEPVEFKQQTTVGLHSSKPALAAGILVVILTLALYLVFSPLVLAK